MDGGIGYYVRFWIFTNERERKKIYEFNIYSPFFIFWLLVTKSQVCESRSHALAMIAISRWMAVRSFDYSFSSKSNFLSFIRFQPKHHYNIIYTAARWNGRVAVFMALCCHVCAPMFVCVCMVIVWLWDEFCLFLPFKNKIRICFILCVHMSCSLFMGFSNFTR